MRQGRRQFVVGMARLVCSCALSISLTAAWAAEEPKAAAAVSPPSYWQAPALPSAVIQGGAIPPGWQPQPVPYQGIGPDGRPLTVYFAPTYTFTYQSGPPVPATPQAAPRGGLFGVNRPGVPGQPYVSPWNYQTSGAAPAATMLPPATVARYQPAPYQFPPNSRALTGTPIVPAGPLPAPVAAVPPPPPMATPPLAPPPQQWVPSSAPPPPGMAGAAAAPALAGAAAGAAAGVAAANAAPALPPVAPIPPAGAAPSSVPAQPVSSGGLATPPPATSAANTHVWKCVAVYDGDTVTCIDENNQQQKIRLAEIDAPEARQDFGQVSRQALAGMVFGKMITVVDAGKDRYGRWIGHLYADGVDVNRQMVATGMAWHYAEYSKDSSLATLQSQAQAQKLGLWSQPNPVPPSEFRKSGKKST